MKAVRTIFFILLIKLLQAALHEELLELACYDIKQCKQFEKEGVSVACLGGQCRCSNSTASLSNPNSTAELLICAPPNLKQSNFIGGHCPCRVPMAECNNEENICYCEEHYTASDDKRSCIREMVALNGKCEMDIQCNVADNFAICDKKQRICTCRADFIPHFGVCVSVAVRNITCTMDSECQSLGAHMVCATDAKKCICIDGYVRAEEKSECLPVALYGGKCSSHLQCQKTLGPGGSCIDEKCHCSAQHYVTHKNIGLSGNQFATEEAVCEHYIKIGEYCRENKDCYQHQLPLENQTMCCIFGECNCRRGYYSINDRACIRTSRGCIVILSLQMYAIILLVSFKGF